MRSFSIKLFYAFLCAALLLALVGVQPAYAASFVVNTLNDENTSGDGFCSLREAIASANNAGNGDCGANSTSDDTITFSVSGTIALGSALPAILSGQGALTIDGGGVIAVDGVNTYQIFFVSGAAFTLQNITVINGRAPTGGGIYNDSGTVTITASMFSGNRSIFGNGGAISNRGILTVSNSTLSGNSSIPGFGGAISSNSGTLTVSNSTLSGNIAISGGGIYNQGTLTITNSMFSGNGATGNGGGLYNSGGTATITNSTFSNNIADATSGQFVRGGAIYTINGSVTVANSTFNGNRARISTTGFLAFASGGAIDNDGNTTVAITNSTFFGNSVSASTSGDFAEAEAVGGGIYNGDSLTVRNSTFSDNVATATTTGNNSSTFAGGGGIYTGNATVLSLFNTIIANSTNGDCDNDTVTLTENNNLIEDSSNACGLTNGTNGDIVGSDPNLGSLANNGGNTQTMALLSGSPAINKGRNSVCTAAPVSNLDQRGVTRITAADPTCDIGAYEFPFTSGGTGGGGGNASALPATGFPQGYVTVLPPQPSSKAYSTTELILDIPSLKVKTSIVGVPQSGNTWDVTWLGSNAGWLNGTAFPTWTGNSVITGHVWNADNTPGIFVNLKQLKFGDQIKIQAYGQTYTYEVRENRTVRPDQVSLVTQHQDRSYLTLVTCENYNLLFATYSLRRMVRAVLISVQ